MASPRFEKVGRIYTGCALQTFTFLIFFVAVNAIIGFAYKGSDQVQKIATVQAANPEGMPRMGPLRDGWQLQYIDMKALADVPLEAAEGMLDDMTRWNRYGFVYRPWVQFGPPEFHSQYVNVDTLGPEFTYRRSIRMPPADMPGIDVFIFGGSTTFGFHSADDTTVASYLAAALQKKAGSVPVRLINFGRSYYYSTQEVAFLDRTLRAGFRPHVVVFLDGLNDTMMLSNERDAPAMTGMIEQAVEEKQIGRSGTGLQEYSWIPMVRLAYSIRQKMNPPKTTNQAVIARSGDVRSIAAFVEKTYRYNVEASRRLATAFGFRTYHFWQPVPFYRYDMKLHRTPPFAPPMYSELFPLIYDRMRQQPDILFLGDALSDWGPRKAFVDDMHYNPPFSRFLAEKMAESIDLSDLKPRAFHTPSSPRP